MLSVIVITKNESVNIRLCLQSVAFADEIIVIDSGSTDDTVAIAKEFTPHVFIHTDWQGYGIQKQRALSKTTGDWVLNIDADERVSDSLKTDILTTIASDGYDAYKIPIQMCFYNTRLQYISSPKRHIRLFKRALGQYSPDIVHERVILPKSARIGQMRSPLFHYSYQDIRHALYKINKYSSYSAKMQIKSQRKPSLIRTILGSMWMFFRGYVLKGGFLDGRAGFLCAVFNAHGTFYKGMKLYYHDRDLEGLLQSSTKEELW